MSDFRQRFAELRREKGLSYREIADALGLERTTVGKWENAGMMPSVDTLSSLASYLDVSLDYLTGRSEIRGIELPDDVLTIALHRSADDLTDEAKEELIKYAEYLRQRYPAD